jgi:hypothetical protein
MGKDLTLIWKTFLAFAGDRDTRITDLKLMHTGGLLVAIQTKKGYQQSEEAWSRLLRIDTAGETVWEYTMEGPAIEDGPPLHYIEKVLEGQDHDLYVLASSSSVGHVSQYYSITRLDSNGVMRSRNFLDKETSYSELLETKQGRIMMVGKLGTYDEKGGLLTTIDNKGRITDNILYPAEGGVFQKVIPLRSGFLLFGFAESPYTQASNYWLIATKQ